jgi:hypothetical protein
MIRDGAPLTSFLPAGVGLLVMVIVLFVIPPVLAFLPLLARTRFLALQEWGRRMARTGESIRVGSDAAGEAPKDEQAWNLEEIEVAVHAVQAMLPFPLSVSHLVGPLLAAAAPAIPLLFIAFSAGEILEQMVKLVL